MSNNPNTPVFPSDYTLAENQGLSKREYFAGQILPTCYADATREFERNGYPDEHWRTGVAIDAYKMADAMLDAGQPQENEAEGLLKGFMAYFPEATTAHEGYIALERLEQQRDDLLAALKTVIFGWEAGLDVFGGIQHARAVVAKVEGGAA